jgi:hypothetical protein
MNKINKMNKVEKLTLIEGEFIFDEAKEILINMFSSKINFHNIKNWSSQERFGKDDEIAQKRIPALRNEMKKLEEVLLEAKGKNKKLMITSEIKISLLED